jgi:hypothetical protein
VSKEQAIAAIKLVRAARRIYLSVGGKGAEKQYMEAFNQSWSEFVIGSRHSVSGLDDISDELKQLADKVWDNDEEAAAGLDTAAQMYADAMDSYDRLFTAQDKADEEAGEPDTSNAEPTASR